MSSCIRERNDTLDRRKFVAAGARFLGLAATRIGPAPGTGAQPLVQKPKPKGRNDSLDEVPTRMVANPMTGGQPLVDLAPFSGQSATNPVVVPFANASKDEGSSGPPTSTRSVPR